MEELSKKDFDQVFDLLKLSFISDELRPYGAHKALMDEPIYHIYAERDNEKGQQLKAFIAIWDFETFLFVDYFAVHPQFRDQGIGHQMLQQLTEMTEKEICLEIETPVNDLTRRRLHFYERNHFKLCKLPYVQPPIARGNAPVALSLMSSQEIETHERFNQIKSEIYEYAYKRFI